MKLMDPKNYSSIWKREENLDSLNQRIHDGVPLNLLSDRANGYTNTMFEILHPCAKPQKGSKVLEFGSGVGYVMESMLRKFPIEEIIGLDISKNMIEKAQQRWQDNKAKFVLYDGFKIPFPNDYFDTIYSVAAIQHIEKHIAFLLFRELYRILAPKGHAVLHFLSVHHLAKTDLSYDRECWNHINNNTEEHWHHYYSYDELHVLFSDLIGVDNLNIRYSNGSYFLHFSKGTNKKAKPLKIMEDEPL